MIAPDQTGQIKRLARRVRRKDMLTRPVADHLRRDMGMACIGQI